MINWLLQNIYTFLGKKSKKLSFGKIYFERIIIKNQTPKNSDLKDQEFIEVNYKGKSYWVIFKCPCGCGEVITLPLIDTHDPFWEISRTIHNRPTIYPSVWQNKGCYSHFWIEDGKIEWCRNTGNKPLY